MIEKVNLAAKLATFSEHWSPKLVGEVNSTAVKLVKFKGEFVWHSHALEDELFYVVKGSFTMRLHDGNIQVNAGEFVIVPAGTEHQPYAEEEVEVMLVEPNTTLNTGNVENERTVTEVERI